MGGVAPSDIESNATTVPGSVVEICIIIFYFVQLIDIIG